MKEPSVVRLRLRCARCGLTTARDARLSGSGKLDRCVEHCDPMFVISDSANTDSAPTQSCLNRCRQATPPRSPMRLRRAVMKPMRDDRHVAAERIYQPARERQLARMRTASASRLKVRYRRTQMTIGDGTTVVSRLSLVREIRMRGNRQSRYAAAQIMLAAI